ncbi:MAG TPA: squalene--hopene cyclase, partial [Lacipirellulaceae bacterium]|nr:squalene--hopene cyclase [Lacipirellulaceae bacterium]
MAAEALPLIEEIAQDAPATEAVALPIDSLPTVEPAEVANASPADVPTLTEVATVASSPYSRRNAAERLHWAEQQGGSRQTEAAVAAALAWLAKAQSADGRWDARQYGAGVEMVVLGQNRNGAGADADPGISALALLAFLGAGHTHQSGDYQRNVHNGLNFLAYGQAADGNLAPATGLYAQMYCHSMATFALAEAMAMTNDRRLEPVVQRAVNFCLRAQHPSTGGWRYRIGDLGDTSQLGWQLMALWSADNAGIRIPPQTWTGAERFLRSVRRGRYGGLASYRPDGPASTPMTAEALYCRHLLSDT